MRVLNTMSHLNLSLDYLPKLPREKSAPIGCIGSGFIMADCHLVAYRKAGFNPVAIASRTPKHAREVAQRHGMKAYDTYEAMLASGRTAWRAGDRVRVYRTKNGAGGVLAEHDDGTAATGGADRRDYDVDHYVRVLRDTFAARLIRALTPDDYDAVFSDPEQPSLFTPSFETMRPVLTRKSKESD